MSTDARVDKETLDEFMPKKDESKDNSHQKENWDYSLSLEREQIRARLGKGLTPDEQETTIDLLWKHKTCFATNDLELGQCPWVKHNIDTGNALSFSQMPYKSAFKERERAD